MPQTRPHLTGRPVALFVFSNLREQKGGLTKAFLRRLAIFHEAGWDTHVATIHPQPEIDETLDAWRARGWLSERTQVHHYQRRQRRFRPAWSRPTDDRWTRDHRIADWLDWLVGLLPGVVVFADSPVTYAPVAMMRNPFVGRVMTVHLAHRGSKAAREVPADEPSRSIYQGPAGTPKLSGRFLPFASAADVVVAPTGRQAEHLQEELPGLDVRVIPNIVERPVLEDPPTRDPSLVVQLGRLDPFKRVDHAIRAVGRARYELPDLRLAIYGRGPDLERLVALRDELGLQDAVTFEGFTDDPLRVLASASASIMTSKREGFGLAVAESLSVGTPVVSYDIDYGPAELLVDGVNGRVVANGSVRGLAAALLDTVGDPIAWRSMSAAGPSAVDRLQADVVGAQWLALADEIAARVDLPDSALLVEDLRVTRDGLTVAGVALGARATALPETVRVGDDLPDRGLASEDARSDGPTTVREVSASLPWDDLIGWPAGASLTARDRAGSPVDIAGPGVPNVVVPVSRVLLVVSRDSEGRLKRQADPPAAELTITRRGARAALDGDVTPLGPWVGLDARLVGPAVARLAVHAAGLRLTDESEVPVVMRGEDGRRQVGVLLPEPGSGSWKDGRWDCVGRVTWDGTELARAAGDGTVLLSLGAGRRLRQICPLGLGGRRPVTLTAGGRWLLAATSTGQVALIRGRGWRARVSAALSRPEGKVQRIDGSRGA